MIFNKTDVANICNLYPEAFNLALFRKMYPNYPEPINFDVTRRLLIPIICEEACNLDGPESWKLLYRMDREDDDPRKGRLSSDIIIIAETKRHFDVLTDKGPAWSDNGIITNPKWELSSWKSEQSFKTISSIPIPILIPPIIPVPQPLPPIVDYNTFVTKESWEIAAAYLERHGHSLAISDMYHNAYRRLVERQSHEAIINDIKKP